MLSLAQIDDFMNEVGQNDGAGPLTATLVFIRPVRGCGDPLASETLTLWIHTRCITSTLAQFGTTDAGRFDMLATRDQDEIPLSPFADLAAIAEALTERYTSIGWAQVPA